MAELDPLEMSLWLQNMKGQQPPAVPPPGISPVNSAVMTEQVDPGLDEATLVQAASAQLPTPRPAYSNAARRIASSGQNSAKKAAAQQAITESLSSPEIEESLQNENNQIGDLKKQIENYMKQPREMDWSPLAALTDAWSGSNFSKTYRAPQTDAERIETMTKLQNMVTQRQGDLTKQRIAYMVGQLGGKKAILGSEKDTTNPLEKTQDILDSSAHQRVLHAVKKDPVINGMFQQARRLTTALDFVKSAKITTPQQLDETQQTVRRQLGITGTSGVDERSKTMLDSLGLKGARVEQYLFGSPVDVKESHQEFLQHLIDLVDLAQRNNAAQMEAHLATLTAGNEEMYERRPDLQRGLYNLNKAVKGQFQPQSLSASHTAAPTQAPTAASPDAARKARIAELRKKLGK